MKNKIMIPSILVMSFLLCSFRDNVLTATATIPTKEINVSALQKCLFGEQMSCAWITSLTHNGEDLTRNFDRNIFCFHPDGLLEACNDLYCDRGGWEADNDIVQIAFNAASISAENSNGAYDWLNGTWKIIERSENVLELEKIDRDNWRVRFETITR